MVKAQSEKQKGGIMEVTRRHFLKMLGLGTVGVATSGFGLLKVGLPKEVLKEVAEAEKEAPDLKVVSALAEQTKAPEKDEHLPDGQCIILKAELVEVEKRMSVAGLRSHLNFQYRLENGRIVYDACSLEWPAIWRLAMRLDALGIGRKGKNSVFEFSRDDLVGRKVLAQLEEREYMGQKFLRIRNTYRLIRQS